MNLREFWAAEAAKLRNTSYLSISNESDEILDDSYQGEPINEETQKLVKLYNNESEAYKFMWAETASTELERYAWITNIGVLVMPLEGYTADNQYFKTIKNGATQAAYVLPILYPKHTTVKGCFVKYQNKWIKVIASMHTHPAFSGQNVVSGEDERFMNNTKVLLLVLTSDKVLGMLPDGKTYARFETDERTMLFKGQMQIKRDLEQIKKIIKQRTNS
ncbi:MAG: hypothetical protein RLZZ628_2934 [Bacteroidota bacterium]|jgi:hypothetical protein